MNMRRSLRNKLKLEESEVKPVESVKDKLENKENTIKSVNNLNTSKSHDDDEDGSSSDSSVENYLKSANEIDLNSSFFKFEKSEVISKTKKRISNVDRLSDTSDSETDDKFLSTEDESMPETKTEQNEQSEMEAENATFKDLQNYNKKIEETKFAVQNYKNSKMKEEKNTDIKRLLSVGESKLQETQIKDEYMDSDSENEMDWEEVEDKKMLSQSLAKIPKQGVQITVELPTTVRKKKADDYAMMVKRKLNRIRKETQVFMHKVHLLCWIAHGNYVNVVLNSENLLGLSLSLIPSEQCYPPKHADLDYLEQITKWYHRTIKLVEKTLHKVPDMPLEEILHMQINKKEANSKKNLVLLFICILRALGLQCRLVLSLQCLPLRPPSSELCSLSTKKNDEKTKKNGEAKEVKSESQKLKQGTKSEKQDNPGPSKKTENQKSVTPSKQVKTNSSSSSDKKLRSSDKNASNKKIDEKKDKKNSSNKKTSTSSSEQKKNVKVLKEENKNIPSTSSKKSYSKKDDSEEDFQSDNRKSISSPEKSNKKLINEKINKNASNMCTRNKMDVRNDIIDLIKGGMAAQRRSDKQKIVNKKKKQTEDSDDSDYVPEPVKKRKSVKSDSEDEFKHKKNVKVKKTKLKSQVDSRVLSTDEDEKEVKRKVGNDVWAEVFLEAEEKWISVDVVKCQVHCVSELFSRASSPAAYIVAWNNNLSVKDVTCRYCPHWNTVTRKLRVDKDWWTKTLKPYIGVRTAKDKEEDEDLARQQLDQPLPKTISEYKNHPLYALKRHLLKFEAIYPPDALTLGFVRNEPVYARECVHTLHSREIWIKHAKVVKLGEKPYKIVKARPKYDKLTGTMITDKPLEIFGIWQVDDYVPPTAKDGIVPRNEFGNVELFKPCMLPGGTVHLQLPGLNKVARKLQIDCAPALVGFEFHAGGTHPTFDGYIVCEEFKDTLVSAWEEEQNEIERREREKIEKRVYDNWKKLIKGLLIRERLKARYEFSDASTSGKGKKKKSKGPRFVAKRRRVISGSESDSN